MAASPLRVTFFVLLLTTSLHDVISFSIHKRHSRSTDLGDALRMLERQRQHFGNPEDGVELLAASSPELRGERPLSYSDLEPWFNSQSRGSSSAEETLDAAWLAKTLGLDGYNREVDGLMDDEVPPPLYLQPRPPVLPPVSSPVKVQPTDQELDAIFGEKDDDKKRSEPSVPAIPVVPVVPAVPVIPVPAAAAPTSSESADKKDKEVMTEMKGDVKETLLKLPEEGKSVIDTVTSEESASTSSSSDDVTLTKEEFRALLKAVEKLQRQALEKAEVEVGEAEEVMAAMKGKVEEARQEAKEAVAEVEAAEDEKKEEEEEKKEAADISLTPKPQPVSNEELDSLFEETKEVIPTDHGEIVKTDKTLTDKEGRPVGKEEKVEEVEEVGGAGGNKQTLKSIEDFWYLKSFLNPDGDRKKRNSKPSDIPPNMNQESSALPEVISPPDSSELIAAYLQKINELQSELNQARLESYLEDVENDILTEALNQATLAQARGRINPEELDSLQDAIRVEEALQKVKATRLRTSDLLEELREAITEDKKEEREKEEEDEEPTAAVDKRGEPWKKRDDEDNRVNKVAPIQAEVPVFLTGDSDYITSATDDVITPDDIIGDDSEDETTSVALGKWFDEKKPKVNLADLMKAAVEDLQYLEAKANQKFIDSRDARVASLFSDSADGCPAVQEFSTNCQFAGASIDFEARALCNVHEMCYACGESLGVGQNQCDFIYRAASGILCRGEERCELDAEIFLNAMKLKHRFLPQPLPICRTHCTAEFLSIV